MRKSLLLLGTICGSVSVTFTPGVTMLCLDKTRLGQWEESKLFTYKQRALLAELNNILSLKDEISARKFLVQLDEKFQEKEDWHKITIKLAGLTGTEQYELLKGPDALFRNPCKHALLDAFSSTKSTRRLVHVMKQVMPLPLEDLNPESLNIMLNDNREQALDPFLEIIDRGWQLGRLMELALQAAPGAYRLRQVYDAYCMWQTALYKLLEATARPAVV